MGQPRLRRSAAARYWPAVGHCVANQDLAAKVRAVRAQQRCPAAPDLAEAPAPLFRPVAAAAVAIEHRRHRAGSMAAGSSVPAAAVTAVRRGPDSKAAGAEATGRPAHWLAGAAGERRRSNQTAQGQAAPRTAQRLSTTRLDRWDAPSKRLFAWPAWIRLAPVEPG